MNLKLRGFFVYLYDETQYSSDADKIFVSVWKEVNKWIPLYCCSTQHNVPLRGSSNDIVHVLAKENEVGGVREFQMDIFTQLKSTAASVDERSRLLYSNIINKESHLLSKMQNNCLKGNKILF